MSVSPVLRELRVLLRLGLPVMGGQVGMMMLHLVDTLMLGQYGVSELAAAALGTQWIFLWLTVGLGLVQGIDPLVSQRHGARDGLGTGRALQDGLILAVLGTLVASVALSFTEPMLVLLGQTHELSARAHSYVIWQLPSVFPFLAWVALRSYLQGREIVRPAMWVMLPVNAFNALFNWFFIFGPGPFPEWGLEGAAIATCLSRFLTGGLLLAWVLSRNLHHGAWERPRWAERLRWSELRIPLTLGLASALQMGLEVSAFAATAFVAGQLGEESLAAHAIVLSFASMLFMVPLGVSVGTTTRVGNLIGAGSMNVLGSCLKAAALVSCLTISLNVSVLIAGRNLIATAYTDDLRVHSLAAGVFVVVAAFQISDCVQVVISGALRGMGRTTAPAVATFLGYYVFGLPAGYYFGVVLGQGLSGLWWGLALGLTVVAAALLGWMSFVFKKTRPLPTT